MSFLPVYTHERPRPLPPPPRRNRLCLCISIIMIILATPFGLMLLHDERDHDCILLTDLLKFSESTPHLKHFLPYDIYAQRLVERKYPPPSSFQLSLYIFIFNKMSLLFYLFFLYLSCSCPYIDTTYW